MIPGTPAHLEPQPLRSTVVSRPELLDLARTHCGNVLRDWLVMA